MANVPTFWLKNKRTDEDRHRVLDALADSVRGFQLLKDHLEAELADVQREIRARNSYGEIPNWDRWVADRLGYARCLDKIIERLSF